MFAVIRHNSIDRTMRSLMDFVGTDPFFRTRALDVDTEGTLAIDVAEGDGELIVRASLPGFKKEDVDIQIHNGVLSIRAEKSEESEATEEHFYRKERCFGSVSRRIALPGVVAEAKANAELKDGVLVLRIPLPEVARPKQIEVN